MKTVMLITYPTITDAIRSFGGANHTRAYSAFRVPGPDMHEQIMEQWIEFVNDEEPFYINNTRFFTTVCYIHDSAIKILVGPSGRCFITWPHESLEKLTAFIYAEGE